MWLQEQRVPAKVPSFLSPQPSPHCLFLPFLPFSAFPLFLIPAQPPPSQPDLRPSPPPVVTSKPKDKTCLRRAVTCWPLGPRGSPWSLPEPRSALGSHPPHPRARLNGRGSSCSFYGARRQRQSSGVPSPRSLGWRQCRCALFTLGPPPPPRPAAESLRSTRLPAPPPIHKVWVGEVGWGVNIAFRAPSRGTEVTWSRPRLAREIWAQPWKWMWKCGSNRTGILSVKIKQE